jgi:O-antigen/teichoic acid export membrane protein
VTSTPRTRPEAETARDVRQAAALSFGNAAAMVLGGVLALLIAHFFGKSSRTDAFFAAYGVYTVALVLAQTFRLTAIPQLVGDRDGRIADSLLGAITLLALLAAVPMVLLAGPLGDLLVENASEVAAESLRSLWPALAGQLIVGLLAAFLVVRGRFTVIAAGYLLGGLVSVAMLVAFQEQTGLQAVSLALGTGVAILGALFVGSLIRAGWRPRLRGVLQLRAAARQAHWLVLASASFLAANLGYVVCVAVASRDGAGEATVYAYAFFTAALLVATTAVSSAIVRTPKLLAGEERSDATIVEATTTYRFTLVLIGPALGLVAVAGAPIADFLLGGAFDRASADRLVVTLLCLSGWVLGSAAGVFAIVDMLARGKYRALAAVAAGQLVVLLPLAIAGRALAGVAGIAVAQSLVMLAAAWIQLRLAFGNRARLAVRSMLATTLRAAAVTTLAFAPGLAIALASEHSVAGTAAAALISLPLAFVVTRLAWPAETRTVLSLLPGH